MLANSSSSSVSTLSSSSSAISSSSSFANSPPPPSRLLWVVRHGERVDNVQPKWAADGAPPRGQWDDPPLSPRGLIQATEVGQRIVKEQLAAPIQFLLCSPFTRCLQTAQQIIAQMAAKGLKLPEVLVEPGFCESLNACQNPPGFPHLDEIRQSFPSLPISTDYQPCFLPEDLPTEECTNFCCFQRVIGTLKYALKKLEGNLVVVSHGSPISAIHFALSGQLDYMGQCTISHYRLHWPQKVADENLISSSSPTLFPMSGGGPLPLPCKSIVIRALPPKRQLLKAGLVKLERCGRRRNTMPIGAAGGGRKSEKIGLKKCVEKGGNDDGDGSSSEASANKGCHELAISLARLVNAGDLRAEMATEMMAECLAAGDSGHLTDKRDLHNVLYI